MILLALAACASPAPRAPPRSTCTPSDVGDPTLYTVEANAVIAPPQTCAASGPHEAYIHVEGVGSLPFSIDPPGKATGCTKPGAGCTYVDLGAFLATVTAQLKARGADPISWGLGRCNTNLSAPNQTWDDQHWSIVVYHWKDANAAVSIVAEQLHAWDAAQSLEVSVEAIPCGVAE